MVISINNIVAVVSFTLTNASNFLCDPYYQPLQDTDTCTCVILHTCVYCVYNATDVIGSNQYTGRGI